MVQLFQSVADSLDAQIKQPLYTSQLREEPMVHINEITDHTRKINIRNVYHHGINSSLCGKKEHALNTRT